MTRAARLPALAVLARLLSCGSGDAPPAALDTRNDTCRSCRMPVSDARVAAQLAAPGEEPMFFDDLGCLQTFLAEAGHDSPRAIAYVTDHRTGAWVRAASASFSRCPSVATPMSSHLLAHADASSRNADTTARACAAASLTEVFGPAGPPDGRKAG